MKTLTANALTEIAKQYGIHPRTIVQIEWEEDATVTYTDQDKVLTVEQIENVLTAANVQSMEVAVTLDDTDGSIKNILNSIDIHKKKAIIYQNYQGLTDDDKFSIFVGQISSPLTWGEGDRQVTFTILSEIETYEIGFSPEEGQLDFVSPEMVGQPWPLAFGDVVHVPARKVKQVAEATLLEGYTLPDPTIPKKIQQFEDAVAIEHLLFSFWQLVMVGAGSLTPPIAWLLNRYSTLILSERSILALLNIVLNDLDIWKRSAELFPGDILRRATVESLEADLESVSASLFLVQIQKAEVEAWVELAEFGYNLKKRAGAEQIRAYDRIRELYFNYHRLWYDYCNQQRLQRASVRVQDSIDIFPQETPVDVIIKGVKFRVQFDDDVMTFLAGPFPKYQNVEIDEWVPNDEPCSEISEVDDVNIFWLTNDENLEDLYLLVKKRGTDDSDGILDRHIIKVTRQVGKKVYFDLIEWDREGPGGSPRGLTIDHVISEIVETPFVVTPQWGTLPAGIFTGDLDPVVWNLPQSGLLLDILDITGPVNEDELRYIIKMLFLLPSDRIGDGIWIAPPTPRGTFTIIGEDVGEVIEACSTILPHWLSDYEIPYEEEPDKVEWYATPGTKIRLDGDTCEVYIVNILPSTIKAVHAYRTNEDGERFLAPIPSRYYIKNESANLGTYTVTALTFLRPLDERGEGWEDDVFVTMNSSVGPNVVDIIQWIIETYIPDKTVNVANFAAIKTKQENYPANFAIIDDRPDALDEIQRIAWEARMAVLIKGNEFFLKYLSEEPDSDDTFSTANILRESLRIEHTRTEDLVTEMIATYKKNYLPLEGRQRDPRLMLRHNMQKYGLHRREEFFHIYNIESLVEKSATFWMIRQSNTWKKVSFTTNHSKIRIDTLDTITLDAFFANDPTKCVVEKASYNPEDNTIEIIVHTPVRNGEMDAYVHFWPADNDPSIVFPLPGDYVGGVGPGSGVTGTIEDCPT